jgi:hypothetical protein
MKERRFNFLAIVFLFTFLLSQNAIAKKGLVIDQVERTYVQEVLTALHANSDIWDNQERRIKRILETDPIELDATARKINRLPDIDKMKLYIQGEMFLMDSETKEGKTTIVLRNDLGMMYYILWAKNTVIKMSKDEIDKMRKGAMDMTKQIQTNLPPNIAKMLDSLPEPQRTQALEAMKRSGQSFPGMTPEKAKPTIENMHRSKDFPNFKKCSEFNAEIDKKHIAMWGFGGNPKIAKMFHEFGKQFKNTLKEDDDIDPHELLPKHLFPVFSITYSENMMSHRMDFKTWQIDKIELTTIPISRFEAYKDPKLKEGSIMDMAQFNGRNR